MSGDFLQIFWRCFEEQGFEPSDGTRDDLEERVVGRERGIVWRWVDRPIQLHADWGGL